MGPSQHGEEAECATATSRAVLEGAKGMESAKASDESSEAAVLREAVESAKASQMELERAF